MPFYYSPRSRNTFGLQVGFGVSKASLEAGIVERYGLQRDVVAVEHCRDITKKDMKRNEATPEIKVDADTYQVWVDGEKVGSQPLEVLPMAQRYFLF